MPAKIGSYKGHATITLSNGQNEKYPFTFGIAKAVLILAHLEEIKRFVAANAVSSPDRHDMREADQMAEQAGVGDNQQGRF